MKNPVIPVSLALILLNTGGLTANTVTTSNSLTANIQPANSLTVTSSVPLTHATTFNAFTGTDTLTYRARTTSTGTGGAITLRSTADFGTGGPSISGGELSFTCGAAGLGTPCSGSTTVTASATTVVTLPQSACTGGGGSCSASNPNSLVVTFSLLDNPGVQTGMYSATIQFTISTT